MEPHWHNEDGALCEQHAPKKDTEQLYSHIGEHVAWRDEFPRKSPEYRKEQRKIDALRYELREAKHQIEEGDLNSNEVDSPENCVECGRLCNYSLTSAGIEYVIDHILDALEEGPEEWAKPCEGLSYYKGSRHVEIVRDWAEDLKWYGLSRVDKFVIDHFLEVTSETVSMARAKSVEQVQAAHAKSLAKIEKGRQRDIGKWIGWFTKGAAMIAKLADLLAAGKTAQATTLSVKLRDHQAKAPSVS